MDEEVGISSFAALDSNTLLLDPAEGVNPVMPLDTTEEFETLHAPSYTCGLLAGYCWAGGEVG